MYFQIKVKFTTHNVHLLGPIIHFHNSVDVFKSMGKTINSSKSKMVFFYESHKISEQYGKNNITTVVFICCVIILFSNVVFCCCMKKNLYKIFYLFKKKKKNTQSSDVSQYSLVIMAQAVFEFSLG